MGGSDDDRAIAPTELSSGAPLAAAELPVVDPRRYHRGAEVGHGGLGRVIRADDARLGRTVALKELRGDRADARDLLLREALLTARLQHPGIVPIYDAGYWPDGSPFYAMKLIEGRSLAALIDAAGSPAERLALLPHIIAVAEAVAYAHARGVVHRDIKPQNVVVGAFGETVVLDWGIAQRPSGESAERDTPDTVVGSGGVAGTVGYMAPEQERGQPTDARADVYAIGASLYHVFAGGPPGRAPPPVVAPDLQAILDKALAERPSARYPDAGAMASDLRRWNAGQLVSAHRYDLRALLRRWLRRHRAVLSVAAGLCALLAALAVYTVRSSLAARDRDAERTRVLTLLQARSSLASDGAHAIAWLKTLTGERDLGPSRVLAAAARSRGVARAIWSTHDNTIHAIAVSPDGRTIATAGRDRAARLVDVARGTTVALTGHGDEVFDVAFDASGERLATASADGTARVWDLGGHELWRVDVWTLAGGAPRVKLEDAILKVALLDGGRTLVTGDRLGRLARTTAAGAPVLLARLGVIDDLRVAPGGLTVAAHCADGSVSLVRLDGSGLVRLATKAADVGLAWITPDGIATADGGTVTVWSATGERRDELAVGAEVSWLTSEGGRLLVGDGAGAVHRWTPGQAEQKLAGGGSKVYDLATVDPGRVLTAGADGRIGIYDFEHGVVMTLRGHDGFASDVVVAKGALVSTGADGTVRLWPEAPPVELLVGVGAGVQSFGRDGDVAALGRIDGSIDLVPGGRVVAAGPPVFDVVVSSAVRRLAYSHGGGIALLAWDGTRVADTVNEGRAMFLAWSRDGAHLAASSPSDQIVVYDATLKRERVLAAPGHVEARLIFTADGALVSAGWDGSVRLWDLASGAGRLLGRHEGPALGLAVTADSRLVASVGSDGVVLLHDREAGATRVLGRHPGPLNRVAFTPDGRTVVSAGRDFALGVWDIAGGGHLLRGHSAAVATLAISPDGRLAATASLDGTIRLWDLASGESVTLENLSRDPIACWFTDGGARLLTAGGDGTVRALRTDMPSDPRRFRAWLGELTSFTVE